MKIKILTFILLTVLLSAVSLSVFALSETAFKDETVRTVTELHSGVTLTHIELGAKSAYGGKQSFWVVEFDPKQEDLCVDVAGGGAYANQLKTVQKTMENFAAANEEKIPLAGINGDLWMVSYAHARVLGSGTTYGGCSDPVVTKSLTLPRGLDIYDGEIISSPHSIKETPYEGTFQSFGFTADGRTVLGTPSLVIDIKNITQNGSSTKAVGLNRLPADDAIMVYSDKGCEDNYSLDDAYEIIIDCDYDYKISSGAAIKGKVTKIVKQGDANEKMKENRLIICARGEKYIKKVSDFAIGDEIEFTFTLKCGTDKDVWPDVINAVGGHIVLIQNGKVQGNGDNSYYPTSIVGNTEDGRVMFVTMDGRQGDSYTKGFQIKNMPKFVKELGLWNAFLLDGGGSATMVALNNESGNYELQNRPSDTFQDGSFGNPRTVVNSIIVSKKIEKTVETEVPAETTDEPNEPSGTKKGCGSSTSLTVFISACALCVFTRKKRNNDLGN